MCSRCVRTVAGEMKSRLLAVTAAGFGCRAALDAERYLGHRD
jgi:thioredoxin reductase